MPFLAWEAHHNFYVAFWKAYFHKLRAGKDQRMIYSVLYTQMDKPCDYKTVVHYYAASQHQLSFVIHML